MRYIIKYIILSVMTVGITMSINDNGQIRFNNQPVEIEIVNNDSINIDIKEDEPMEHYLDRELIRQEERINEYWEEEYKDYLRDWGIDENYMRGW